MNLKLHRASVAIALVSAMTFEPRRAIAEPTEPVVGIAVFKAVCTISMSPKIQLPFGQAENRNPGDVVCVTIL